MLYLKLAIALSFSLIMPYANALSASSISGCPALTPRTTPAADVTDLRIDDFKVVAALGDSIMAGFGMMGVDYNTGGSGILNFSAISEYRGNSYGIGVDTGAVTIANFIKKYNPKVQGGSVLSHLVSFCQGTSCKAPGTLYRPLRDNLNGAQSGAYAMNLDFELDYLIPRMKSYSADLLVNYKSVWKFLTLQIGSNDQCATCSSDASYVTPDAYGKYVEAAIERIKNEMPKTVINLLGTFKVSGVFPLTEGQSYCVPNGILENKNECSCSGSPANLTAMDAVSDAYNAKLKAIAAKYAGKPGGTFAVMYSPAPINLSSFPVDALSNIDCFHPSLKGHQWIAKAVWNQLFTSAKPPVMNFDGNLQVYCPTDTDRLPTTGV